MKRKLDRLEQRNKNKKNDECFDKRKKNSE